MGERINAVELIALTDTPMAVMEEIYDSEMAELERREKEHGDID